MDAGSPKPITIRLEGFARVGKTELAKLLVKLVAKSMWRATTSSVSLTCLRHKQSRQDAVRNQSYGTALAQLTNPTSANGILVPREVCPLGRLARTRSNEVGYRR
jgi:hypothetical protein